LKLNRRDLLTTAGVLTLASTGPASHAADASRVTLWDIATGDVKTLLQHTVQRFDQHHSDIDVVVEFFQNDPYKTKLRMAMGAGQPPDVFSAGEAAFCSRMLRAGRSSPCRKALTPPASSIQ
jgi:raffinose/stachyose/melibiose transport system substrate-binding protein